jgi:hypothetical protein
MCSLQWVLDNKRGQRKVDSEHLAWQYLVPLPNIRYISLQNIRLQQKFA